MKHTYARRYRRSSSTLRETQMFKKDAQQEATFFAAPSNQSFFKPHATIHRKCAHCEAEDKKVNRIGDHDEAKKVNKKEQDKKLHQQVSGKEDEKKIQKMGDKKEEEKKVHLKFDVEDKEKKVQRLANTKEEEKKIHKTTDKKEEKEMHRAMDKEEDKKLAKKEATTSEASTGSTSSYIHSLNGKGQALTEEAQHFFGERMGHDFSDVKIHTTTEAEQSAKAVNAKAYTVDNHIVFNKGQYNPASQDGKKLLAHELTHVVQQKKESYDIQPYIQRNPDDKAPVNADIPPIVIIGGKPGSKKKEKELIKEQEKAQEIASKSYKELNTWYEMFINLWLTSANTALFQADVPEDATQKSNYNIALAGNLLWAATSLFPEAKAAVVTLSFVGSYIGTGGLAEQAAPTGIGEVAGYLSKSRDALLTKSIEIRQDVAAECAFQKITGIEDQKRLLWQHMFPGVTYNSSDGMREIIRKKLNSALIQFHLQWKMWRTKIEACKSEMRRDPTMHGETEYAQNDNQNQAKDHGTIQTKQIPDIQRQVMIWITPDYTKKCEAIHPFQPTLKF